MTSLLSRSSRATAKAKAIRAKASRVTRARTKAREKVSRARRSGDHLFEFSDHVLHPRQLVLGDTGMISNGIRCRCLQAGKFEDCYARECHAREFFKACGIVFCKLEPLRSKLGRGPQPGACSGRPFL